MSPHPTQVVYAPQPSPFWAGAGTLGVLLLSTITVVGGLLLTAILWLRPLFKVSAWRQLPPVAHLHAHLLPRCCLPCAARACMPTHPLLSCHRPWRQP